MEIIDESYSWKYCTFEEIIRSYYPIGWEEIFRNISSESLSKIVTTDKIIYPPPHKVLRAFYTLSPNDIKVVILGQDPYHNGNATGLCFDVKTHQKINPSLKNIYKELASCGFPQTQDGNLSWLVEKGVLLLNTALTVEKGMPGSHAKEWSDFSTKIIRYITSTKAGIVWLLMGSHAQSYIEHISSGKPQKVFKTSHPSPFSAHRSSKDSPAFLGSNVFKKIAHELDEPDFWNKRV